jgi:hypothetical protein
LLGKPVLDGDILSLNPAKLAQVLPERLQEDRATGSSATLQVTYAEDFPCLLRRGHSPSHHEHEGDYRKPQPFSILDFRFSIIGPKTR